MFKRLFTLIITMIIVITFVSCNKAEKSEKIINAESVKMIENSQHKTYSDNDDSWKYEVAEKLYQEFCYFYDNMNEHEIIKKAKNTHKYVNRNEVGYNCVMAIDRGCGISQVYHKFLSEDKVNYVKSKMADLDYVDSFSGVRFGYTENGLHFIVIYPESSSFGTVSDSAKNKIRNLNNEMDFLYEFYNKSNYFLAEAFVEDLSGKKESGFMNLNFVCYDEPYTLDLFKKITDFSSEEKNIFEKFNRNYSKNNFDIKMNSWNLYAFEKQSIHNDIIAITSDEILRLNNVIPIFN